MEIILCSNTFRKFDSCVEMIKSAHNGTRKPDHTLIIDNSSGMFVRYLEENTIDPVTDLFNTQIITFGFNSGCSIAWNTFMKVAYSSKPEAYVLIANDDVLFHEDTIALFEQSFTENTNEIIHVCGGIAAPNAFSLFGVHPATFVNTVGFFDENFRLPYCEDGDMQIRLWKVGKDLHRIPNATVDHIGSATIKTYTEQEMQLHHNSHARNMAYLCLKWKMDNPNDLHNTGYDIPFDGDEDAREMTMSYLKATYGY